MVGVVDDVAANVLRLRLLGIPFHRIAQQLGVSLKWVLVLAGNELHQVRLEMLREQQGKRAK